MTSKPQLDDLFGALDPCRCVLCGKGFSRAVGRPGRPQRFCSDACRAAQKGSQSQAWARAQHAPPTCWACEAPLDLPPRDRGRLPRYCSKPCRLSGRRDRDRQRKSRHLTT